MNTKHTPQVGDIWTVEENWGNWKCIWEHQDDQEIKVFMLWESGASELLGTGVFKTDYAGASTPARLIERDGKRGEDLWQEWPWKDCPEYRKEQIKKAWEDGYVVETLYPHKWDRIHRNADEPFDSPRLTNGQPYRITDRKRAFNTRVCQGCGKVALACLCNHMDDLLRKAAQLSEDEVGGIVDRSQKPNPDKQGWYLKYNIEKSDGSPMDPEADYFVLRLDKDPHARKAADAYAKSVARENPTLANDLRQRIATALSSTYGLSQEADDHTTDDVPDPDKFPGLEFQPIDWQNYPALEVLAAIERFAGWYYPQCGGRIHSNAVLYDFGGGLSSLWLRGCTVMRPTHAAFVKEEEQ